MCKAEKDAWHKLDQLEDECETMYKQVETKTEVLVSYEIRYLHCNSLIPYDAIYCNNLVLFACLPHPKINKPVLFIREILDLVLAPRQE